MFTIDASDRCFVRVAATDVLRPADYRQFDVDFDALLASRRTPFPLLLDLRAFRGWTASGLIWDLRFDLRHAKTFSRIAVIGDKPWHKLVTYAGMPIFKAQLKYFAPEDEHEAKTWLRKTR